MEEGLFWYRSPVWQRMLQESNTNDLRNTSLQPQSLTGGAANGSVGAALGWLHQEKKASFSASLRQQKHCPQPSEGQPPDRRVCVRRRSPPTAERWWIPVDGILHGDLYWNHAASIPRVHRAAAYANLSPDGDKHIRLSILLLFGSRYPACELLSRSLKVMESFRGPKRRRKIERVCLAASISSV